MFCVSIGFILEGQPVIGVINAPFLGQIFSACRGKGAWLNGSRRLPLVHDPIPPMPENAPKGCVFGCEWGKDRRDRPDGNLHRKVESFVGPSILSYCHSQLSPDFVEVFFGRRN
jgi:myo-inositol-1(or 4)-monophosphatase